jgi:hypothetical protein
MSIQENQISDQIDSGLGYQKEIYKTVENYLKQNNFSKQQTKYHLFLAKKTFKDKENFYQQCIDVCDKIADKNILDKAIENDKSDEMKIMNEDFTDLFIREFKEKITDNWTALDFLMYLKCNDFKIV